jgi:5-methylcytosine-specific restriction protein A
MRRDQRSPEADAYRKLYQSAAWRGPHGARERQRRKQPFCELCLKAGRHVPAKVVNHRIPHKGDLKLFFDPANHQSVCKPHHDGSIQSEERRGFNGEADEDGWPTDPRHPANRRTG